MKRPRWRCADTACWAHRWQTVRPQEIRPDASPNRDLLDVAVSVLQRHNATEHKESKD